MARARQGHDRVPALRVVALHGAGSGPWVFAGWELPGAELLPVDLHAGLNVAAASMLNYEAVAVGACELVERPFALLGWSMGGLVALAAARRAQPDRLVLLEPSPPGDPAQAAAPPASEQGTYDPEAEYGPFPPGMRARPESRLARAERRRGYPAAPVDVPALVVSGAEFPEERGRALARRLGADELAFPELSHWDLVRDARVQAAVAGWLGRQPSRSTV